MRPDPAKANAPGAQEREALAALFAAGRYAEAASAAQALIERFPADGFGWNALGAAYKLTGRDAEALAAMQRAAQLSPGDFEAHFNLGNALREAGRLEEAEASFRGALAIRSDYAELHNNLGIVQQHLGRPEQAAESYRRAVELKPAFAEAHNNLGIAWQSLGRLDQAELSYRRALLLKPDYAEACNNLGNALKAQDRLEEAEAAYRRALSLRPDYPETLGNLGNTLKDLERFAEAEASCRRALELKPDYAEAHNSLGLVQQGLRRPEAAEASFRRAIELKPEFAEAHNNLGVLLASAGRAEDAEASYRRALALDPRLAAAHSNLGFVLHLLSRPQEAEASCRRAIELEPAYAGAHNHLGIVCQGQGRLSEAEASYRRALEIKPQYAEAHLNLGNALKELARLDEAEASYRRSLAIKVDAPVLNNLGSVLKDLGRLDESLESYRRALELRPDQAWAYSNLLFLVAQTGHAMPTEYLEQARGYERNTIAAEERAAAKNRAFARAPRAGRRLRIGYVSGDFRAHVVSHFFEPVLLSHDKRRVESFLYSTVRKRDAVTERLERHADHAASLVELPDKAALERIEADSIDVLVDLSGHTAYNRLVLFGRRAAPVQCHYVGYFASTGLSEMDYFIGDEVLIPEAHSAHFSETVWRLPRTFSSYVASGTAPEPAWQPEEGRVCVGSFNHLAKITERTIELWAKVLQRLPKAYLLLKTAQLNEPSNRGRIQEAFARHGIARSRLELQGKTPDWGSHMALYNRLAVALDPMGGQGGATTTCEALWMGVPVVTLDGDRMAGRVTASMVTAIGHEEWRAKSEDEYVEIVARLVEDETKRKELRSTLRSTLRTSPLCDAAGLARALEDAYEAMFDRWWPQAAPGRALEESAEEHFNRAVALQSRGRLAEAEASYRRALELTPDYAEAHCNLGMLNADLGRRVEAEASYRRAIGLKPGFAQAHNNLGVLLIGAGRLEEAEASYRRALELDPGFAAAHSNLGLIHQDLGRPEEAEASCRRAIGLDPGYAAAHSHLGIVYQGQGRLAEAEASYRRALQLKPDFAEAHYSLGNALRDLRRFGDAEASYRRAIELRPDYAEAHSNLGNALKDLGRLDEALESYRRAVEIRPDLAWAYSNLLFLLAQQGRATTGDYLLQARGYGLSTVPAEARAAARNRTFPRAPRAGRRLRVGYVSGDFRKHVVSHFFEPVLQSHDRSRVESFLYSTNLKRDEVTQRLERHADHWVKLAGVSDDEALKRCSADGIDVLVDLSGHTAHNRLGLFVRRAAPVQCHYVGYFASTGLSEMDYWIGDEVLIPEVHDAHFSEVVWRLPRIWSSYVAPADAPEPAWQPERGRVCLGSFNNLVKVNEHTIALWAKVLQRLPNTYLLLKTAQLDEPSNRERIRDAFERHGIGPSRLELQGKTEDSRAHMALYGRLAVALDPIGGQGGATTTCDALWMGVAVATLDGDRMSGRVTASMVTAIGHPEWRAKSEEEYVEIVARLVEDETKRKELRSTLRETMRRSALCDAAGLARALEDAYEAMFDRWWSRRGQG